MSNLLSATDPIIQKATSNLKNLRGIDAGSIDSYVENLATTLAPVLSAKANIIFALFYGNLTVKVNTDLYSNKSGDVDIWGIGAAGGTAIGMMYTAFDNWDAFFHEVTAYHVQGLASGGGVLQINWFTSNGMPVGQFNGAMGGAGGLQAGGAWTWKG
jgi:hypothetical protein